MSDSIFRKRTKAEANSCHTVSRLGGSDSGLWILCKTNLDLEEVWGFVEMLSGFDQNLKFS